MATIRRIHVPLKSPEEIVPHLGAPHHWKEGRSAKCLIDQWWVANDVPRTVRAMLEQAVEWRGAELIDAFAERCTDLRDGRPSHSQSDMLAVLGVPGGIGIISIEAKVDEGFDKTVDDWRRAGGNGKAHRLSKLCRLLGIADHAVGPLRYQLLHRTASAVIEAKRYRAGQAAMIVQSWSKEFDGFADFNAFQAAVGLEPAPVGALSPAISIDGISVRMGWSAEAP